MGSLLRVSYRGGAERDYEFKTLQDLLPREKDLKLWEAKSTQIRHAWPKTTSFKHYGNSYVFKKDARGLLRNEGFSFRRPDEKSPIKLPVQKKGETKSEFKEGIHVFPDGGVRVVQSDISFIFPLFQIKVEPNTTSFGFYFPGKNVVYLSENVENRTRIDYLNPQDIQLAEKVSTHLFEGREVVPLKLERLLEKARSAGAGAIAYNLSKGTDKKTIGAYLLYSLSNAKAENLFRGYDIEALRKAVRKS